MNMVESIGKRIAYLRVKHGWTQQSLVERLAMSRVAISHIEMDLSIPSERTITLMAGVFKLSPTDLVKETTYPRAKAERLPELTAIYSELEHGFFLLKNDMEWLRRVSEAKCKHRFTQEILLKWYQFLEKWDRNYTDEHEEKILAEVGQMLQEINDLEQHYLK